MDDWDIVLLERLDAYANNMVDAMFDPNNLKYHPIYQLADDFVQASLFVPLSQIRKQVCDIIADTLHDMQVDRTLFNNSYTYVLKAVDLMNNHLPLDYYTEILGGTVYIKRIWTELMDIQNEGLLDLVQLHM